MRHSRTLPLGLVSAFLIYALMAALFKYLTNLIKSARVTNVMPLEASLFPPGIDYAGHKGYGD